MLGVLAKYIFGGIMGDAPETTAPEMQYHTREVKDWLLVDMPDQAIDDEDMDSQSDDDEILTALPLLMSEEVIVQPLQIVQPYEKVKNNSVCDNSLNNVQRRSTDKICSVPSVVQHHSGDKIQGNFVDNVQTLSVEVKDALPGKIQDVSTNVQSSSVNTVQDEYDSQFLDAFVDVKKTSIDVVQDVCDDMSQSEVHVNFTSETESNSVQKAEVISVEQDCVDKIHEITYDVRGSIYDEVSPGDFDYEINSVSSEENSIDKIISNFVCKVDEESVSIDENYIDTDEDLLALQLKVNDVIQKMKNETEGRVLTKEFDDKIHSIYSNVQENSNDTIINTFVHKVEEEPLSVEDEEDLEGYNDSLFDEYLQADIKTLADKCSAIFSLDEPKNHCDRIQPRLIPCQEKINLANINHQPLRPNCAQKRLYSQVVAMGRENGNLVEKNSSRIQANLNSDRKEFLLENFNHESVNNSCLQRRLYSQVVKTGLNNQNFNDSEVDIFGAELRKNYDRYVRVFSDEIRESSDDEMNETSDDEMNENSRDKINKNFEEINESSDGEVKENSINKIRGKFHRSKITLSSDEESDDNSEEETSDFYADFQKRFHFVPSKRFRRVRGRQAPVENNLKITSVISKHNVGSIDNTKYEHTVDFTIVPQCWYAYQTWHESTVPTLLINLAMDTKEHNSDIYCWKSIMDKKMKRRQHQAEKKLSSSNDITPVHETRLITNSAEILQNLINQKSTTILPTKTAVILEHIKEWKPVQEAIQFDNRKYLTRSQLNRQNRNYMFQSSVKTNRRKNLQRNPSGANNNRKC